MNELNGRIIEGEVQRDAEMEEQHPDGEFTSALDELLGTDGVEAVKWEQYTPYFNDGDACVFHPYEARLRPVDGDEEAGDYSDGFLDDYGDGLSASLKVALGKFNEVLTSGYYNVLLVKKFGDHAEVTATKEKFVIDSYDHD